MDRYWYWYTYIHTQQRSKPLTPIYSNATDLPAAACTDGAGLALAPGPGAPGRKAHLVVGLALALVAVLEPFELVSVLCAVACA